jgi:hypothetical protein
MRLHKIFAVIVALVCVPQPCSSQDLSSLDDLFDQAAAARAKVIQRDAGVRDPLKQVEAPEIADNSTSVLDTSSAADLIAVALSLSSLTASSESNGGDDGTAVSATVTTYALWSAIAGFNPLDPGHYCEPDSIKARRLAFLLGRDDGEDGTEEAIVGGFKFRLPIGTDECSASSENLKAAIRASAFERANVSQQIQAQLRRDFSMPRDVNPIEQIGENKEVNDRARQLVEQSIDTYVEKSAELDAAIAAEIKALTDGNRFAFEVLTSQSDDGFADEYTAALLWDQKGTFRSWDVSANAGWELIDNQDEDDDNGGSAAIGLQWHAADRNLEGRRPMRATLAANATWMVDSEDTYKGQIKFVLPLLQGLELPISITVANRTELIDETEVRGLIGISVDTTGLLASLER